MKTINLKSAFVTASVIALLSFSSSANAQWYAKNTDNNDKSFREKIEDKLDKEQRENRRDVRWDPRYDRRDVKYNNGRFIKRNRYERNDCCNCSHDNKFDKKNNRKKNRKHH